MTVRGSGAEIMQIVLIKTAISSELWIINTP
jgi:hypothetical protein